MNHYKPKRVRWGKVFAFMLRGLAGLLSRWPLFVIAAILISPIGPHLRWQYTYQQHGTYLYMLDCQYIGSRGFVRYREDGKCPVIAIIDRRKH